MEEKKRNFNEFKLKIKRTPTQENSYQRRGSRFLSSVGRVDYSIEQIYEIIKNGDPVELRELSRYYFRTSGLYKNAILYLSNLLLMYSVVTPIFDTNKKVSKNAVLSAFYKSCDFVDALNLPINLSRINQEILISGIYFGILRAGENGKYTIQDLPLGYCRTRFKDYNNLDIPEFRVTYFDSIHDEKLRKEALAGYPKIVQKAYDKYHQGFMEYEWVEIYPEYGGMCFSTGDKTPLLAASIPSILKFTEAQDREAKRDENELYKLLIQKMPIDKGELVFELEEVAEIHASVAEMVRDLDTVDVLTTFGDASLESVQDSSAASQSANRIEKYKTSAYDELGIPSLLFNADGSGSMVYSIQKDESIMYNLSKQYATWVEYQINNRYGKSSVEFGFSILPISLFNCKDMQSQYFSGAQYGYSKMHAGVAMGFKQSEILSMMVFENEFLNMSERMLPLQSSYTSSNKKEEKKEDSPEAKDINNSGGRPEMEDTQKTEKTQENIASAEG
jgi:hypothetical protein